MFKTILVAVDGSDHALKAVDIAADLAQKYDARLVLLSVFKHLSALETTHSLVRSEKELGSAEATMHDFAKEAVKTAKERAKERGAQKIESFTKEGRPARTIVAVAKEKDADAIIMGNRGLGDFSGFMLGSVSHKVSALAECTVITVK